MNMRRLMILIGLLLVPPLLAQPITFFDPTMPLTFRKIHDEEQGLKGQPVIDMILVSNHRRLAVMNGKIVKVGDIIEGIEIIAIDRLSVTVQKGDKVWTIEWMANIMSDQGK